MNKSEIIECIKQLVPAGYPEPKSSYTLSYLKRLTAKLIEVYRANTNWQEDPFSDVYNRTIYLYETQIRKILNNKVVLVTGGKGCVGTYLIEKLSQLGVKRIISVDLVPDLSCLNNQLTQNKPFITYYTEDIRDFKALDLIFKNEKPDFVFHLAGQRLPWLGEIKIRDTITSNILGTENIIKLCEKYRVQKCIFSSTGKASNYITKQIYCATKKMSEWLLAYAAQHGKVIYGAVRFTHIINNSSVCQQIDEKIQQDGVIKLHNPNRYVVAQNVIEASHLLLNALVFSQPHQLKILTVKNLGWPVETLDIALYKLVQAGKILPIYFQGCQPGYEEPFFQGSVDWDNPKQITSLINALETPSRIIDDSGDMYIFNSTPFSSQILINSISELKSLLANPQVSEMTLKQNLGEIIKKVTYSTLVKTSSQRLLKILRWGINSKQADWDDISLAFYRDILDLFAQAINEQMEQNTFSYFSDGVLRQENKERFPKTQAAINNPSRKNRHKHSIVKAKISPVA